MKNFINFFFCILMLLTLSLTLLAKDEKWTVYDNMNSQLPDNMISCIMEDINGIIYISTDNNGFAKFVDGDWTAYNPTKGNFPEKKMTCIAQYNGYYWLGTYSNGVIRFDGKDTVKFNTDNSIIPNNRIFCMMKGPDNSLWIGTKGGLVNLKDDQWTVYSTSNSKIGNNMILSIAIDSNGYVTIGSQVIVSTLKNGQWIVDSTAILPGSIVWSVCYDRKNTMWIGTSRGLIHLDNGTMTAFSKSNSSLSTECVRDLTCDRNGNIWIATSASSDSDEPGGVYKYDGEKFVNFNSSNSPLPDTYITSIYTDSWNNIWMGTRNSGITVYSNTNSCPEVISNNKDIYDISTADLNSGAMRLDFSLRKPCRLSVKLYDILGNSLGTFADGEFAEGVNSVDLELRRSAVGVCFVAIVPEGMKPCVVKAIRE